MYYVWHLVPLNSNPKKGGKQSKIDRR